MGKLNKILYDGLKLGKYGTYGVRKVLDERIIHTDSNFTMSDCLNREMKDSTWGKYISCGATSVKEIENNGMFIVQMCNLVFVDLIQGINKILSAISIPYPLGESAIPKEEQYELRSMILP